MLERCSSLAPNAFVQRLGEIFGRNNMRMFLANRAKLHPVRVLFEPLESVAAQDGEMRVEAEQYARQGLELKRCRMAPLLAQHVDDLAVKPNAAEARTRLRQNVLEKALRAHRIEGLSIHDLREGGLSVDKQNAIGVIERRTVPAGLKVLGDSVEGTGSTYQDQRFVRARILR